MKYDNWKRYPWQFSAEIRNIVVKYIEMRYRLMPTLYYGNWRAYNDGTPLFQRCDLLWPASTYPQAKNNNQYIFGDDILVRPVAEQGSNMSSGKQTSAWVPPGDWFDAWTDEKVTGPKSINVDSKLWHMPMFIRRGSIVMSVELMQYTTEKPWDPVILDVYPPATGTIDRTLYEDDGVTNKYLGGECGKTKVSVERAGSDMKVTIGGVEGNYTGQPANRAWIVRLHLDEAYASQPVAVQNAGVDIGQAWDKGTLPQARILAPQQWPNPVTADNIPMPFRGEGAAAGPDAAGPVIEIWLPGAPISTAREITLGTAVGASPCQMTAPRSPAFAIASGNAAGALTIGFNIPAVTSTQLQHVKVGLYDGAGRLVQMLVNSGYAGGFHSMTINLNRALRPGCYFGRCIIGGIPSGTAKVVIGG
jgi:hypothetical protein